MDGSGLLKPGAGSAKTPDLFGSGFGSETLVFLYIVIRYFVIKYRYFIIRRFAGVSQI